MNISIKCPIQKIGHLMRTDAAGYLINECNWEAIQLHWLTLVEALRSICIPHSARNGIRKIIRKQVQGANNSVGKQEVRNLECEDEWETNLQLE